MVPAWHYRPISFMASDHKDSCYHDTTGIYDVPRIQYTYIDLCEDLEPLYSFSVKTNALQLFEKVIRQYQRIARGFRDEFVKMQYGCPKVVHEARTRGQVGDLGGRI